MSGNVEILLKSLRLAVILNIADVVLSSVVSKVYSGGLDLGQVSAVFGNFALILAMLLFFYSGAIDLSGTARWSTAMRILGIGKGEWKEGDSRRAERRALVYFACGGILLAETIALAILLG